MRNFVKKYSDLINRPKVEKDKKKTYQRKNKHRNKKDDDTTTSTK